MNCLRGKRSSGLEWVPATAIILAIWRKYPRTITKDSIGALTRKLLEQLRLGRQMATGLDSRKGDEIVGIRRIGDSEETCDQTSIEHLATRGRSRATVASIKEKIAPDSHLSYRDQKEMM